jgi:hypothetical protein
LVIVPLTAYAFGLFRLRPKSTFLEREKGKGIHTFWLALPKALITPDQFCIKSSFAQKHVPYLIPIRFLKVSISKFSLEKRVWKVFKGLFDSRKKYPSLNQGLWCSCDNNSQPHNTTYRRVSGSYQEGKIAPIFKPWGCPMVLAEDFRGYSANRENARTEISEILRHGHTSDMQPIDEEQRRELEQLLVCERNEIKK